MQNTCVHTCMCVFVCESECVCRKESREKGEKGVRKKEKNIVRDFKNESIPK